MVGSVTFKKKFMSARLLLPILLLPLISAIPSSSSMNFYGADDPHIRYTGRVDFSNPKEPHFWQPGVYVEVKFEGSSCQLYLKDEVLYGKSHNYIEIQEYFTMAGEPLREESWLSANPRNPYDTVVVYDDPHNPFKANRRVVKLEASTVKNGTWKYYDPSLGTVAKTENYLLGKLQNGITTARATTDSAGAKPPPEVEQYNKKNSGKKKYDVRTGQTGY